MLKNNPLAPDDLGPTLCIGEILCEIVATKVGNGFREPQNLLGPFASGAPAIFIDQCARMGGSAAIIGAVGDDDFGILNKNRLKQDGVDISGILTHPNLPTGTAFVRYRKDGKRDFVFNMWTSAAGTVSLTNEAENVINRAGHLHVMGTLLVHQRIWEIVEYASKLIKARGGTISLDPNIRKELKSDEKFGKRFTEIMSRSDLLLPSVDELCVTAEVKESDRENLALERLFEVGIPEIVVKRGNRGASYYSNDRTRIDMPAFSVSEVDPTGAGDCFGGAYVACRRLGMEPMQALCYANAAGAKSVTAIGPMEGLGTRSELTKFIKIS